MRRHIWTTFILLIFISCSNHKVDSSNKNISRVDSLANLNNEKEQSDNDYKTNFNSINEVVHDKKSRAWVKLNGDSASCALHFNLGDNEGLVSIEYSPECWIMFPYKISADEIIIYWAYSIDTKYDFKIVKTIEKIGKKYADKPFIILKLTTDSTLTATYPIPDIIKQLNSSDKDRKIGRAHV